MQKKADRSLVGSLNPVGSILGPAIAGSIGGAVPGALLGATYNALLGKPQLFYDDVGRGAARGALVGGGAGIGFGAGGSDPNSQRIGARIGAAGGTLAGNIFVRRNEDDDEYLERLQRGDKKPKKKPTKYTRKATEKQSKVYEASEAVDGMHVKHTKMNHKKCTPGEFGMNKEGTKSSSTQPKFDMSKGIASANMGMLGGGLAGMIGGGVYGAYNPGAYGDFDAQNRPILKRRSRLMGALRGAAGYGLGGAALGRLGGAMHGVLSQHKALREDLKPIVLRNGQVARAIRDPETGKVIQVETDNAPVQEKQNSDISNVLVRVPLFESHKKCTPGEFGAMVKESADSVIAPQPRPALGPMANRALKSQVPVYQKRTQHGQKAMDKIMGNSALSQPAPVALKSAHDFGAYVKQSFLGQVQQHLPAIGTGAAVGAGLAGLHGFMNPGEEDEYDAQGRVVGRKQRSRLGTMLNRALMGAGVGGAAMGVGSAMFPQYVNPALQKLYGMFQSQQTPSNYGQPGGSIGPPEEARLAFKPQSQQSLNDNIGEEYGAGPKLPQSPVPPMLLP